MNSQVKNFSIKLLGELIESGNFINCTSGSRNMNVVNRFNEGVTQEMLYAVEYKDSGEVTILSNTIINTLLWEAENTKSTLLSRRIRHSNLQVCIAVVGTLEEELQFKKLVGNI